MWKRRMKKIDEMYYTERKSMAQVGKHYGVSRERIRQVMEKFGRQRRSGSVDFSEDLKQEIRKRRSEGEKVKDIANAYNVCQPTIYRVFSRKK